VTTATNCLLSTSLNIPMWGNQKKKTQDPLQASKNSQPLTATTVSQTFFYGLFMAHSCYTFVFRTSYWQCSFAAATLLRKLSHERYCTAYCEKQISRFLISYLQNLVSSFTNAKKFLYRTWNSPVMSEQLMFCTEQYDNTTCFGPASKVIIRSQHYKHVRGTSTHTQKTKYYEYYIRVATFVNVGIPLTCFQYPALTMTRN